MFIILINIGQPSYDYSRDKSSQTGESNNSSLITSLVKKIRKNRNLLLYSNMLQ